MSFSQEIRVRKSGFHSCQNNAQ